MFVSSRFQGLGARQRESAHRALRRAVAWVEAREVVERKADVEVLSPQGRALRGHSCMVEVEVVIDEGGVVVCVLVCSSLHRTSHRGGGGCTENSCRRRAFRMSLSKEWSHVVDGMSCMMAQRRNRARVPSQDVAEA